MSRSSRYLSLVLRHAPDQIDIKLDSGGWTLIDELLRKMKKAGRGLDRAELFKIVESSDKQRFTISADGRRIRAAQGHSFDVDLGLDPMEPPEFLFHGTASHSLDVIFAGGLRSMKRRHVHLSPDAQTAVEVGRRHGKPVVLRVEAERMQKAGHVFYRADNGVWLTDEVPSNFLKFGVL